MMRFRPFFYTLSFILLAASLLSSWRWGFRPSIDFAGGTVWEFKFNLTNQEPAIQDIFQQQQIAVSQIIPSSESTYLIKTVTLNQEDKKKIEESLVKLDSNYQELRFESLGPTLGQELLQKTIVAIILSVLILLFYIARRFNDLSFGLAAVLAMIHDAVILVGSFSIFGYFFGAELDALFVTALLTTLSASVHDTVVTFDRIREFKKSQYLLSWTELANQAVRETLVRSINNSMTIIFMLLSLVVLGGTVTRWFATALLVGVISGTYSSIGVAVPLMLWFKKRKNS